MRIGKKASIRDKADAGVHAEMERAIFALEYCMSDMRLLRTIRRTSIKYEFVLCGSSVGKGRLT